jgi:uncharacterized protein
VELKNELVVQAPLQQAWPLLLDVASIAECVPGGELVEKIDDRSFKGRVSVKLGPILLTFEGIANFTEIDEANHRTRVEARGSDKKGRGTAQADLVMQLIPDGAFTKVSIVTDLQLAGSVAQYGRASGLLAEVSQHLLDDFSENLNRRIRNSPAPGDVDNVGQHPVVTSAATPISAWTIVVRTLSSSLMRLLKKLTGNA